MTTRPGGICSASRSSGASVSFASDRASPHLTALAAAPRQVVVKTTGDLLVTFLVDPSAPPGSPARRQSRAAHRIDGSTPPTTERARRVPGIGRYAPESERTRPHHQPSC